MEFYSLSNCSELSNRSDELKSNASTLSGLSTYQDEFTELRHIVNPLKYPSPVFQRCSTPKQDFDCNSPNDHVLYNDRVSILSCQLENSLKLNEKYRNDLYNLEKNIKLKYYEKINKLLKSNHRAKIELDNANSQIERLIKKISTTSGCDTSKASEKNIQLEQKYHELSLENCTLRFDLIESKNNNEEGELQNKQLKIELNELKIDLDAKQKSIEKLKEKISEQHVEIEMLQKNNLNSTQLLNELSSEIKHTEKIHEWYKDQLHACQNDKRALSDDLLKYKTKLSSQKEIIEELNLKLAKCQNRCDLIQLEALKEKEKFMKQLDDKFSNICKNNQIEANGEGEVSECICKGNNDSIINYYETTTQDLTNEIIKIKEYVQEQDTNVKKTVKENAELISRCVTLQKVIQQREIVIEELENSKKHLNLEISLANEKFMEKSDELISYKNQLLSAEMELKSRNEEKTLIEDAIKNVREQFGRFKSKHEQLEEELLQKNKRILQLENEKQKLFMDNSWNICELERSKEKDVIIDNLKLEVTGRKQKHCEQLDHIKRLQNEIRAKENIIIVLGQEKDAVIHINLKEIRKYEEVFIQYKVMVTNYEKQVNDLQKVINENNTKITDLQDNIKILKDELNRRDSDLNEMNNKYITFRNELLSTGKEPTRPLENCLGFENCLEEFVNKNNNFDLRKIFHAFSYLHNNTNLKTAENDGTNSLLQMVESGLQKFYNTSGSDKTSIDQLLMAIQVFSSEIQMKFTTLDERIKLLHRKITSCCKVLNTYRDSFQKNNENEKIQELIVLIQVKNREMQDRQKKYEINNRTLLRKVKEHMKGRNAAEKHNKYLQELYNTLSDENNSLKLVVTSKDYEIENIKKQLDSYITINNKLNKSLLSLEEKLTQSQICSKCIDYAAALKKIEMLEKCVNDHEDEKAYIQGVLKNKEDILVSLHQETKEMLLKNHSLNAEIDKYAKQLEEKEQERQNQQNNANIFQVELRDKQLVVDQLQKNLETQYTRYLESNNENNKLKAYIGQLEDRVKYFSTEIEILSSTLQHKTEEFEELKEKMMKMESNWIEKDKDSQKTVITLKSYLQEMQCEINSVNSEKYFLQRLCSDLKLALRTYVNHNKVLKEQVLNVSKEKQDFSSLPNILQNTPTSTKYDDGYINNLLQQNKVPLEGKPLIDIKGCLDTLRKEISTLQNEIVKKNIGR